MSKTLATEAGCNDATLHRKAVFALEQELLFAWAWDLPLTGLWEVSAEFVEKRWKHDSGALLSSYWHEMSCGCVFGALRCVPQ